MIRVVNSIMRELSSKFPNNTIYVSNIPVGFKRPSFYIKYIDGDIEDLNRTIKKHIFNFQIVYFGSMDANNIVSMNDTFKYLVDIEALFSNHIKLEGEDKYLIVESIRSSVQEQNLIVTIGFSILNLYSIEDGTKDAEPIRDVSLNL